MADKKGLRKCGHYCCELECDCLNCMLQCCGKWVCVRKMYTYEEYKDQITLLLLSGYQPKFLAAKKPLMETWLSLYTDKEIR